MPPGRSPAPPVPAAVAAAVLFPTVYLEKGAIVFPEEGSGPTPPLTTPEGVPVDIFDAVDMLLGRFERLYVVDLEGIRSRRPQFEYLQELARGQEMWVDAGTRNAEEVMDVLVGGATRAVLSTATLSGPREIARSLKLTSQLALDLVVDPLGQVVATDRELAGARPADLAREARERGIGEILITPRGCAPDWGLVADIARGGGSTYLRHPAADRLLPDLAACGARGGIFDAKEELERWMTSGS